MENNQEMIRPESPCVKKCRLDHTSGYCVGCLRTLTEITRWPLLGHEEKEDIYQKIETRNLTKASE